MSSKNFKPIQIQNKLVQIVLVPKRTFPSSKNFKKYNRGGFEEGNNFIHRNCFRFKIYFELKIWEVKV
jgi:hypothetical protein